MRRMMMLVAWMMLIVGVSARAQQPAPTTAAANPVMDRVLPEIKFDGIPLDEVVNFLRDITGANIALIRDGNVPPGEPAISARLKNVTLKQFLEYLTSYGVQSAEIQGPPSPIIVLRIKTSDQGEGGAGGPFGGPAMPQRPAPVVKVYRLKEIVAAMTPDQATPEQKKAAMNDVLSLIQAALEQSEDRQGAAVSVHQSTQTLIFKGTPTQQELLQQTLNTLEPQQGDITARLQRRLEEMQERVRGEVEEKMQAVQGKAAEAQQRIQETQERLQKQFQTLRDRDEAIERAATSQPKD